MNSTDGMAKCAPIVECILHIYTPYSNIVLWDILNVFMLSVRPFVCLTFFNFNYGQNCGARQETETSYRYVYMYF